MYKENSIILHNDVYKNHLENVKTFGLLLNFVSNVIDGLKLIIIAIIYFVFFVLSERAEYRFFLNIGRLLTEFLSY